MERRNAARPGSRGLLAPAFGLLLAPLALAGALVAGPGAPPACAAGVPHAALVVATGDRVLRSCVTLDAPSVTAIHVIELAHAQHGLEYRFGFGGQAVCALAGVGSASGDCFGSYPEYWGFWVGAGDGAWVWSGSGAGSALIHDGDVEGWSWGSGDTGTTHPPPPPTTETSVCGPSAPPPSPTGSGRSPSRPPPRASAAPTQTARSSPGTSAAADGGKKEKTRATRSTRPPGSPVTSGSPGRIVAAAAISGSGGAGGPPAGAAIAIAAASLLGLAGWLRIRGRSASTESDSGARERHP